MSDDVTPPATPDDDVRPVRRALLSVFDKSGVVELARDLVALDVELVSTGSTARMLRDAEVPVLEVADVTGSPEVMGGRVKTLHPRIHGGILVDRDVPGHLEDLHRIGGAPIDLVVVNLYPFADTVASGATDAEIVEMIDVGGPTMIRAAAKNLAHVGVVVDPSEYGLLVRHLKRHGGLTASARRELATKAFSHTATYDAAVANWFHRDEPWPRWTHLTLTRSGEPLRYGENPHQEAAFYVDRLNPDSGLGGAEQLHGRPLSYNNYIDTDAAFAMAADFDEPCVAIVKHTNPAGLAVADTLEAAYGRALAGDPVSAFGGIVAVNRTLDAATARRIVEVFTEVVLAPQVDEDALEILRERKNLRVLRLPGFGRPTRIRLLRSVDGGVLVQDGDVAPERVEEWRVATTARPDDATMADLRFAWTAAKHVKSNAIVLARDRAVVGIGAGQMSRVDAVRLAVEKSDGRHQGAVLASDAFFPFRDGPDEAAKAGVAAIAQPGGSVRDDEVVAAADEHGIAMVLTGRRHFRH